MQKNIKLYFRGERTRKIFPIRANDEKVDRVQRQQITTNTLTARYEGAGNGSYIVEGEQYAQKIKIAGTLDIKANDQNKRVYDTRGISPSLTTMQGGGQEPKVVMPVLTPDRIKKRQNGRRFKDDGEPSFTLTSQDRHGIAIKENKFDIWDMYNKRKRTDGNVGTITATGGVSATHSGTFGIDDGVRIRKLTPKECWRLQGFPDWAFDKAASVNSDSQLYKQAGNSVTVNVIYEIAKRLS